jgi:hypothetical protein
LSDVGIGGAVKNWENPKLTDKQLKELKNAENVSKATGEDEGKIKEALKQVADSISTSVSSVAGKAREIFSFDDIPGIQDIFKQKFVNPKDLIEGIRNSNGISRDEALLKFQGKLDKMSEKELRAARDYLVNALAEPKNKDDELLGLLLNAVNKELDSRDFPVGRPGWEPINHPIIDVWPEPVICPPFPPNIKDMMTELK